MFLPKLGLTATQDNGDGHFLKRQPLQNSTMRSKAKQNSKGKSLALNSTKFWSQQIKLNSSVSPFCWTEKSSLDVYEYQYCYLMFMNTNTVTWCLWIPVLSLDVYEYQYCYLMFMNTNTVTWCLWIPVLKSWVVVMKVVNKTNPPPR